ncbi:hypothetical protein OJAV_G00084610 [Oryzias javanicus]|uniref:Uncharacterized protein n=1 Tax=Oryzias javanicus TaxID=123683 RepID=A0A3S2P6C8_ORYJA|nr:hypothetical protein OJAV_G00084610 [Oryzias javanicus]
MGSNVGSLSRFTITRRLLTFSRIQTSERRSSYNNRITSLPSNTSTGVAPAVEAARRS